MKRKNLKSLKFFSLRKAKKFLSTNAWKLTRMKLNGTFNSRTRFGRRIGFALELVNYKPVAV